MAEDVTLWSTTAASNSTADPAVNWAEGQARASVNNSARSMMAAHAKDRNLKNGSIVTGGTANAQTILSGHSFTAIPTPFEVLVKVGPTLTSVKGTPVTINMDGIGSVGLLDQEGVAVEKGLVAGAYAHMLYNGTNWIFLDASVVNVSNVTLITEVTVIDSGGGGTPVALVDFTDLDTTEFQKYQLVITDIRPEIDEAVMVLSVSTDNCATLVSGTNEYESAEIFTTSFLLSETGIPWVGGWGQLNNDYLQFTWALETTQPESGNVIIDLFGFEPGLKPSFNWQSSYYKSVLDFSTVLNSSGYIVTTAGCNSIRLWMSEGNIARAKIALYGIPL